MTERYTNEFYYKHALTEIANGEEPAREIAERMLKAVACLETVKPKPKDLATLGREIADAYRTGNETYGEIGKRYGLSYARAYHLARCYGPEPEEPKVVPLPQVKAQ